MQEKYGKDGLVVMAVNIDLDEKQRQQAAEFLRQAKSNFPNLMWAPGEDKDAWDAKFVFGSFPSSYLYDREGNRKEHFEGATHEEIEKQVKDLLAKK